MIPRFPKKSTKQTPPGSSVLSIEHDPATNIMTVTFHGGRTYQYSDVPRDKFKALQSSESKGTFINEHVAPHHTAKRINALRDGR
uniref:KTSC domain-containing protein n=1 Tax=Mycena chlorophos TaxID=658473 RepID=A0ABQ0KUB0_MYCCL|nr:predicted protein [Mycena chlorophos]